MPRNIPGGGPILFSKIEFVNHSYGKHTAEDAAARLDKYKKYCACPAVLSEECIQCFSTYLELHKMAFSLLPFEAMIVILY